MSIKMAVQLKLMSLGPFFLGMVYVKLFQKRGGVACAVVFSLIEATALYHSKILAGLKSS